MYYTSLCKYKTFGGLIKKRTFLTIVFLLLVFSLSAGATRIGSQVFAWGRAGTQTIDGTSDSITEGGVGISFIGSYFLDSTADPTSIGLQIGLATVADGSDTVRSAGPLSFLIGVSAQHRLDFTDLLGLDIGLGILDEITASETTTLGVVTKINRNIFSLSASAKLVVNLLDQLVIVGGVDLAFPLVTSLEHVTSGSTDTKDINILGATLQIQVGAAYSF